MHSLYIFIIGLLMVYPVARTPSTHIIPEISQKIKGITMVAPPREFTNDPMVPIAEINANWVALVPYGFSRKDNPEVRFHNKRQWWGERTEGIRESIQIAHKKNLRVMLKPQVYIGGGWVGEVDFDSEEEWLTWEETYKMYIMTFAQIAAEEDVGIFCIGTEYKIAAQKREKFWRKLIEEVRLIYNGKITYSSNWDGYKKVPFWDAVDFIGLSAYFPLTEIKTPSISLLKKEWKPILSKLKKFSKKQGRQILFTEYGYLSVDYCADKNWLLEKQLNQLEINQKAQANAYHALLETFGEQEFWSGGFLWKWFPDMRGHEGYPDKDYTPQGKSAEEVIKFWYGKI
jgi:hypothetical protein